LAAALLVALGLRLFLALDADELRDDERFRYGRIAANLRAGRGFTLEGQPTAQSMPLWPVALSMLPERIDPRLCTALLSACAVGLAWLLARRVAGARVAIVVALLMALDLDQAKLGATILTEPLFGVLLLALALAWTGGWTWAAAGLAGLATLTRPEAFLLPFAFAIVFREWKRPLVLLFGVAVAVTPWTLRNARELDAFVPFTTTGGITLNAGMNETEEGLAFRRKGQGRGKRFRHALVMARERTEVRDDRDLARQAIEYARTNPLEALELTAAKAMLTFTPVQRKITSVVYALAIVAFWWALLARRARWRDVAPFLLVMAFVCLVFLAIPRYRAPYHAFVFLVAAQLFRRRAAVSEAPLDAA